MKLQIVTRRVLVSKRWKVSPVEPHGFGHGAYALHEDIATALGQLRGILTARGMSPSTEFVTT